MTAATSAHVRSLHAQTPVVASETGSIRRLTRDDFPILDGLSISQVILAPQTAREPQWTVRGQELGYCVRGHAEVTVVVNGSEVHRFPLGPGEMFYVPEATLVSIENVGIDEVEMITCVADDQPQTFGMSSSLAFMTDAVLGNTFGVAAEALARREHGRVSRPILALSEGDASSPTAGAVPYWFDVENAPFVGDPDVGGAREAKKQYWPILEGISMFSLRVTDTGMRESHWHPMTVEMGYIAQGKGRMSVLDPDGTWDTYELDEGDVYFVPRSYPHMIEDIGDGDIHFLIFFDRHTSGDIGYRLAMSGMSPALSAATFGLPTELMPPLVGARTDPQFVAKVNPLD